MPTLLVSRAGERLLARPLGDRPLTIGRDPAGDVYLDDPRVSRLHATLEPGPGGPLLTPRGRLPVVLNGTRLAGPAALAAGDRVTIGAYELVFADGAGEASGEPTLVPEAPTEVLELDRATGRVTVRRAVLVWPEGRCFHVWRREVRIGKGPGNDVVLTDPYASVAHCVISLLNGRFVVRDLHSTNGTFVDGRRVGEAELPPGSTLRIGQTRLTFQYETVGPLAVEPGSETECEGLVGRSPAMRRLFALVRRVAPTESTVLVLGETGTGKELVARALHALSPRRGGPFVAVNCGALAADVVESELFGHEKGAFTGALARRAGAFEAASGGTLFLDEVGELPPALQPKLLRVLEGRTVTRVGGAAEVPVDVRIVAATHRDLEAEVRAGRFREDLFYRLHVVPLDVPPLRDRPEDLPLLAQRLLARVAPRGRAPALAPAAQVRLAEHDWPGNVRELRNVLERAVLLAGGDGVGAEHIRFARVGRQGREPGAVGGGSSAGTASRRMDEVEREAILTALEATGWNKRAAARDLGIAKSTLHEKIRRWGLAPRGDR